MIPEPVNTSVEVLLTSEVTLGSITDLEDDNVSVECDVNPPSLLISCDTGSLVITISSTAEEDIGTYTVDIVLTDDNDDPLSTSYSFTIDIAVPSAEEETTDEATTEEDSSTEESSTEEETTDETTEDTEILNLDLDTDLSGGGVS
eukprot:CAMPEP_0176347964 /NCGR_PEP_ID=MMETSP0126-20121128/7493_1 /TAXON_ID=141414 ORGANISM="Strombidinopsis acuminatum, Strain SPMC142" /NCGR_SAMPLE_ID=MMETSP0126 /ASSEMBLY_ACC=CAM_ASM_000229 /LENGTH=145 /DNA_ID=CAMNT_0017696485 /DNA_START=983 /DNA_END=1420 /DNA_ORIENTATION=+